MRVIRGSRGGGFFQHEETLDEDRWVFAFILNWGSPAETDPKTVTEFAGSVSRAMQIVKGKLTPWTSWDTSAEPNILAGGRPSAATPAPNRNLSSVNCQVAAVDAT